MPATDQADALPPVLPKTFPLYGQAAIVLALFGGVRKFPDAQETVPIRGDTHVLIVRGEKGDSTHVCAHLPPATASLLPPPQARGCCVDTLEMHRATLCKRRANDRPLPFCVCLSSPQVGDPGLGKSQMLQAAAAAAPRGVYVCGATLSSAGLTVSVARVRACARTDIRMSLSRVRLRQLLPFAHAGVLAGSLLVPGAPNNRTPPLASSRSKRARWCSQTAGCAPWTSSTR